MTNYFSKQVGYIITTKYFVLPRQCAMLPSLRWAGRNGARHCFWPRFSSTETWSPMDTAAMPFPQRLRKAGLWHCNCCNGEVGATCRKTRCPGEPKPKYRQNGSVVWSFYELPRYGLLRWKRSLVIRCSVAVKRKRNGRSAFKYCI